LTVDSNMVLTASGKTSATDIYTVEANLSITNITGIRLEILPLDDAVGRANNGNFVLSEFQAKAMDSAREQKPVALANPLADFSAANGSISQAIDGNAKTGWSVKS